MQHKYEIIHINKDKFIFRMCNITIIRFNKTDGPSAPSWFPSPSFLQSENINFYIEVFDQFKFNNAVKLICETVG